MAVTVTLSRERGIVLSIEELMAETWKGDANIWCLLQIKGQLHDFKRHFARGSYL